MYSIFSSIIVILRIGKNLKIFICHSAKCFNETIPDYSSYYSFCVTAILKTLFFHLRCWTAILGPFSIMWWNRYNGKVLLLSSCCLWHRNSCNNLLFKLFPWVWTSLHYKSSFLLDIGLAVQSRIFRFRDLK